jgi:GTP-binding protein
VVAAGQDTLDRPRSFVLADLPGLIDGASTGAGLGHRFLRHLSRCAVLVHVLDPLRLDPGSPGRDLDRLKKELRAFEPGLSRKSQLVALGKMDLAEGPPALAALREARPRLKVYPFSSATGSGLKELVWAIWQRVEKSRKTAEVANERD